MVRHTGRLADDVNLVQLAEDHELAGGAIANVVRFAAINALQRGRSVIQAVDLQKGIVKELRKEGRTA
jgi:ATP-dependent 26S proteasome regulatory subunit